LVAEVAAFVSLEAAFVSLLDAAAADAAAAVWLLAAAVADAAAALALEAASVL